MAGLLVQMELQKAGHVHFEVNSEEDKRLLSSGIHILDFLDRSGRGDLERRAVVNHVCNALFADMLHFIYEALRALEKRKFSVAFSLLRKPLKEGMLITALMCADEVRFLDKLKNDAKNLLNRRELDEAGIKKLLDDALSVTKGSNFTNSSVIYDSVFSFKNAAGFASLFDKATHLVTEFPRNRTEDYNLNFIFKNPTDNDIYSNGTYPTLAMLLLFLHVMQIELYGRMREPSKIYQNWLLFTSIGAFEALFSRGQSRMTNLVNSTFGDLIKCSMCDAQIKIRKSDAPRFFINEHVECRQCQNIQNFPLSWLLSQIDFNLSDI